MPTSAAVRKASSSIGLQDICMMFYAWEMQLVILALLALEKVLRHLREIKTAKRPLGNFVEVLERGNPKYPVFSGKRF